MRTLTLLRHAKSDWPPAPAVGRPLDDRLRPLSERGRRDAPRMAAWMAAQAIRPDLVLCSTAARTRETLELVKPAVAGPSTRVRLMDEIYLAEADDFMELLQGADDTAGHIMLVGHNPGLHDLAVDLAGAGPKPLLRLLAQKLPTAAAVVIDFRVDHWSDIALGKGRLRLFMAPKRLEG